MRTQRALRRLNHWVTHGDGRLRPYVSMHMPSLSTSVRAPG
jgi:hypothetical protein